MTHAAPASRLLLPAICNADPEPGDFVCIPVPGSLGVGIETGQFLAAKLQHHPAELLPYEHAEVYVGQADRNGPFGYTYSAYPNNGKQGATGKHALPCAPRDLKGSIWSSGLYDLTAMQRVSIVGWCQEHDDLRYSWADYGAIATHALHLPVPGLKSYIASSASMICSQYTDSAWGSGGGVHLFDDGRWPGYVTPWDLAAELMVRLHLSGLHPEE